MPTRELPERPNLEQYRKQSKDLLKECRRGEPVALQRLREYHPHAPARPSLADAQLVVAREHGVDSWPKFVATVETASGTPSSTAMWRTAEEAVVAGDVATLERLLREYAEVFKTERPKSYWNNTLHPEYHSGDARAIINRTHHFDSWEDFERFLRAPREPGSPLELFETAADAVVTGNIATLSRLLRDHPELIRARSIRNHHATLLHYVGANGIEGWRQHTPPNAVEILNLLLTAGAEVDAVADMYGGSTTLGLVATSLHPERAGLQEQLIDVLLAHGARMDVAGIAGGGPEGGHPLVNACMANGRGKAAAYLASRGAPLDLEAAGGLGRADILSACFDNDNRIKPPATTESLASALVSAAHGRQYEAVRFLLDCGIPVDAHPISSTFTGANWAALNGDMKLLQLFIARGADLTIKNDYGGDALGAALWGAANRHRQRDYPVIIQLLIAAGVNVDCEYGDWWERQETEVPEAHARILQLLRAHEVSR
jgi:hypothetical protein